MDRTLVAVFDQHGVFALEGSSLAEVSAAEGLNVWCSSSASLYDVSTAITNAVCLSEAPVDVNAVCGFHQALAPSANGICPPNTVCIQTNC